MQVIIEMPKGDDRRRHLKADKTGFIDLGPTREVIPVNEGIMPISYGYIPETINEAEGDEIDVLVLSDKLFKIGEAVEVKIIALIKREDGDDKIVAVDSTKELIKSWLDIEEDERNLISNFFSYHFKFKSIEDAEVAKQYLENAHKQFLK